MRYYIAIGHADLQDYVLTPVGAVPDREAANAQIHAAWSDLSAECGIWIYDHPQNAWHRFVRAETGVPLWRTEGLPEPHRFCLKLLDRPCRCHVCTGRARRAPLWAILATLHVPRTTPAVR